MRRQDSLSILVPALVATLAGFTGDAWAEPSATNAELVVENRTLILRQAGTEAARLALPEQPRQLARLGNLALIALGPAGLWVVGVEGDKALSVEARLLEGHDVVGVIVGHGSIVQIVESQQALHSFDLADPKAPKLTAFAPEVPGATVPGAAAAGEPAKRPEGRVVEVRHGRAILDRGRADGLAVGKRIQVRSQELVEKPSLATGQTERVPSDEPVAVLEIEMADDHRASAPLHRGDRVLAGDRFIETSEPPTERLLLPPRQDYTHRFAATFRPFIELGTVGLGSLSEARYAYRFDFPLALEAGLHPLAFELRRGAEPKKYPTAFDISAVYDTDFFAVGLGGGAAVFPAKNESRYDPVLGRTTDVRVRDTDVHFALWQSARLGNIDGLSIEMRNSFVYLADPVGSAAAFRWGSTDVHGLVPVTRRITLSAGGGGGRAGWAYGELGVRTYFKGTGGPGTIIVPVSLGYGGFTDTDSYSGPIISIGFETRWGTESAPAPTPARVNVTPL